jgi:hypothetical protein
MFTFLSLLYCVVLGEMLTEFAMGKQEKKKRLCLVGKVLPVLSWGNVDFAMGKQEKKKRLCLVGKVLPKG